MSIELEPLGTLTILVDNQLRMADGPLGMRVVGTAGSCRWEGERIRAVGTTSPATDWVLVGADGNGTVDARMVLRTHDNALLCVRYQGRLTYRGDKGASVVVAPTFETNDPRYAWLNAVQAVGKGERRGHELVYEMYAVS